MFIQIHMLYIYIYIYQAALGSHPDLGKCPAPDRPDTEEGALDCSVDGRLKGFIYIYIYIYMYVCMYVYMYTVLYIT